MTTLKSQRVRTLQGGSTLSLKKKAAFLDELLFFIEERVFGYLMEETEAEKSLSLSQAKKLAK